MENIIELDKLLKTNAKNLNLHTQKCYTIHGLHIFFYIMFINVLVINLADYKMPKSTFIRLWLHPSSKDER